MADDDIIADNIRAVAAIRFAAILEELRVFQVADRLVALFAQGQLPIQGGDVHRALYERWKRGGGRLDAGQRRALYDRVLGEGADQLSPMWMRLSASVGDYARRLWAAERPAQDAVRQDARALAVELTRRGHGMVVLAAADLRADAVTILRLLGDPEIRTAYGARDAWQVIDRIARDLGGAPDIARHRARAEAGSTVADWLAARAGQLRSRRSRRLLNDAVIRRRRGALTPKSPNDYDLVVAAEQWLSLQGS